LLFDSFDIIAGVVAFVKCFFELFWLLGSDWLF